MTKRKFTNECILQYTMSLQVLNAKLLIISMSPCVFAAFEDQ